MSDNDNILNVANSIHSIILTKRPIGRVLKMVIDIISDDYISEEHYQKYPEIMDFLISAGSDNEELLWMHYLKTHPDIFKCKNLQCDGRIIGNCPAMWCDTCGKLYMTNIEYITEKMCERCVADHIKECKEEVRKRRHQIYAVRTI